MSVEPDHVEKEGRRMEKEVETATKTPYPAEGIVVNRDCCNTVKFLNFRRQKKLCCNQPKIQRKMLKLRLFHQKMQMA